MDYIKNTYSQIRKSLIDDKFNFYALVIAILAFVFEFVIWQEMIVKREEFVYSVLTYFPLELFAVVFAIHLVLAIFAYKIDSYISNFLLGFNIFYLFLILIAEVFYIVNLQTMFNLSS